MWGNQEDLTMALINWIHRSIYVNIGWLFDPFVENPATTNAYRAPLKFSIKPGVSLEA